MRTPKGICAVAACNQQAHFDIVWTNDRIYPVCTRHSDSVLGRTGGFVSVAGELVAASFAGSTTSGDRRGRLRLTGSPAEATVHADDRMSDAA